MLVYVINFKVVASILFPVCIHSLEFLPTPKNNNELIQ